MSDPTNGVVNAPLDIAAPSDCRPMQMRPRLCHKKDANIVSGYPTPPETLEIIAPSYMEREFELYVDMGHATSYKVRVPAGHVDAGMHFQAEVISEACRRVAQYSFMAVGGMASMIASS